jgi:hypothetical protein
MIRSSTLSLFLLAFALTGCEVIGGIFKAGVYTGMFFVILVIVVIIVVVMRARNR